MARHRHKSKFNLNLLLVSLLLLILFLLTVSVGYLTRNHLFKTNSRAEDIPTDKLQPSYLEGTINFDPGNPFFSRTFKVESIRYLIKYKNSNNTTFVSIPVKTDNRENMLNSGFPSYDVDYEMAVDPTLLDKIYVWVEGTTNDGNISTLCSTWTDQYTFYPTYRVTLKDRAKELVYDTRNNAYRFSDLIVRYDGDPECRQPPYTPSI